VDGSIARPVAARASQIRGLFCVIWHGPQRRDVGALESRARYSGRSIPQCAAYGCPPAAQAGQVHTGHFRRPFAVPLGKGFTLVELVVSMCLLSVIGSAVYRVLNSQRRAYRDLVARSEMRQDMRTMASVLRQELEQLDATDPAGGDVLGASSSSITFRSLRNTYFLCRPPEPDLRRVTVATHDWIGIGPIDVTEQTFLLLADGDSAAPDVWLHAGRASIEAGPVCPSGGPSLTLELSDLRPADWSRVLAGAPLQGYAAERLAAYRDAHGDWWLGLQDAQDPAGRTWSEIQPLAGPLAPGGFQLSYFTGTGGVTSRTDDVARIQISIRGRTQDLLGYSAQVAPRDRWAIAAHIRVLQLSLHATLADAEPKERSSLEVGP